MIPSASCVAGVASGIPESGAVESCSVRRVVLDTETTGLSPEDGHRIVEIGAVELMGGSPTGRVFHTYIDPERDIDPGAQVVHGLSRDFLMQQPRFGEIARAMLDFISGAELVIHNAAFDVTFINSELSRLGLQTLDRFCLRIVDTLRLARARHPGQKNSLDALCRRYDISVEGRSLHGALLDAKLLGEVVGHLIPT